MSYRKEATLRITYLFVAFIVSVMVGLIVAALITQIFSGSNHSTREKIFYYSWTAAFAIVCSVLVYKVDQALNKRFNSNP